MFYRLLSWKQVALKFIADVKTMKACACPVCLNDLSQHEIKQMMRHIKRCWCTQQLSDKMSRLPDNHTREDKYKAVSNQLSRCSKQIEEFIELNG